MSASEHFLVGILMAAAALGLAYNALISGPVRVGPPQWIAFWAAVVSMVSKELLYRWTASVGRRINSAAFIANAWHHHSDGISSIPATWPWQVRFWCPAWSGWIGQGR